MLAFELSAIDLILVISVIVLFILYMTKISAKKPEEKLFEQLMENNVSHKSQKDFGKRIHSFMDSFRKQSKSKSVSVHQYEDTECPRGFGNIKKLIENDSVSEKCLGCYNLMDCYDENKIKSTHH
jgi:hypothetical protein